MSGAARAHPTGLLGDTPGRDYGHKLDCFAAFAAPELRAVIAELPLEPGGCVLDAGCGTGRITDWLAERVRPSGTAVGLDLSRPHLGRATQAPVMPRLVLGDLAAPPFRRGFDLVWACNALNHLRDPVAAAAALAELLRPDGRLVVAQSALLPDMIFAWDARLEAEVTRAVRAHYRDKYGLDERDTAGVRNLVGILQRAGLEDVCARTVVIERLQPLAPEDVAYFADTVLAGDWGERLRPYLAPDDWAAVVRVTDPDSPECCVHRPDFHHIQTLTVVSARAR